MGAYQVHFVPCPKLEPITQVHWRMDISISPLLIVFLFLYNRHVMLPKELVKTLPKGRLMSEDEWRGIGVQQSQGWIHYMVHTPEPHILLFRRPITDMAAAKRAQSTFWLLRFTAAIKNQKPKKILILLSGNNFPLWIHDSVLCVYFCAYLHRDCVCMIVYYTLYQQTSFIPLSLWCFVKVCFTWEYSLEWNLWWD